MISLSLSLFLARSLSFSLALSLSLSIYLFLSLSLSPSLPSLSLQSPNPQHRRLPLHIDAGQYWLSDRQTSLNTRTNLQEILPSHIRAGHHHCRE